MIEINNPVGFDDIFFSTTDEAGHIVESNDVFVNLSGYPVEELSGAPHNIIRHPNMPAGAFHAMWETLQSGRAFAAYVRNQAKDGSPYDVVATVTPIVGGYLSVRIRPSTEYFEAVKDVYAQMSEFEQELEAKGVGKKERAKQSAEKFLSDYETLQYVILPAEVLSREHNGTVIFENTKPECAESLAAAAKVHAELDKGMAHLEVLARDIELLEATRVELEKAINVGASVADHIENIDIQGPQRTLLLAPLQIWLNMHKIVSENLAQIGELTQKVDVLCNSARFAIALSRVQITQVTAFLSKGGDSQSLPTLANAVYSGVDDLHYRFAAYVRTALRLSSRIASVVRIMETPATMIREWMNDTDTAQFGGDVAKLLEAVQEALATTEEASHELLQLSEKLSENQELDTASIRDAADALRNLVS